MKRKGRILINDFINVLHYKLGLDVGEVTQVIDQFLDNKYKGKTIGRYMSSNDLTYLRDYFLGWVDLEKINPLDYKAFLKSTNELLIVDSNTFCARSENNKYKKDPHIKTCTYATTKIKY